MLDAVRDDTKSDANIRTIEVSAHTLENIISELEVDEIDFMKMDIEGAEVRVLQYAEESLDNINKIIVESDHPYENGQQTCDVVAQILSQQGFVVEVSDENYVYAKQS